jgi:hypothetical protein
LDTEQLTKLRAGTPQVGFQAALRFLFAEAMWN